MNKFLLRLTLLVAETKLLAIHYWRQVWHLVKKPFVGHVIIHTPVKNPVEITTTHADGSVTRHTPQTVLTSEHWLKALWLKLTHSRLMVSTKGLWSGYKDALDFLWEEPIVLLMVLAVFTGVVCEVLDKERMRTHTAPQASLVRVSELNAEGQTILATTVSSDQVVEADDHVLIWHPIAGVTETWHGSYRLSK